ncbi:MAG: hypothetical protein ABFC71_07190 [Methanoregula sp.]
MSTYHFCTNCEYIKTRKVPGPDGSMGSEWSCPARFNPREGKWLPKDGANPHECPRHEAFMNLEKQSADRRLR